MNSLLEGEHVVVDLTYSNVEEDGDEAHERKVIMDLRCVGDQGEIFLVEMQLQKQEFFFRSCGQLHCSNDQPRES